MQTPVAPRTALDLDPTLADRLRTEAARMRTPLYVYDGALADLAARELSSRDRLDALIRVNPAVEPETLAGLAVGRSGSKFGVAPEEIPAVVRAAGGSKGPVRWRGLHVHVGSQLASVE